VIISAGVTETGTVRKTNEDRFVADPAARLFAVADGMGGHRAGEVASRLAVESVSGFIQRSGQDTDFTWPYGIDASLSFDGNRLRTAIHLANRRIFQAAEQTHGYSGMGTTIVALLAGDGKAVISHVGDSRLYAWADGSLEQLTADDSWAATVLAQDPTISAAEIAQHPMRHVLTNVLGAREQAEVHMLERPLRDGDTFLLSSDGLHGTLSAEDIASLLKSHSKVDVAARHLVDAALQQGSRDNVTALVLRYEKD
jgi:protein phosphatase